MNKSFGCVVLFLLSFASLCIADIDIFGYAPTAVPGWRSAGVNQYNWNSNMNPRDVNINSNNVGSLKQLWNFTGGPISANPTSTGLDEYLYVTDWIGHLYAFDKTNGRVMWSYNLTAFLLSHYPTAVSSSFLASRSSPTIVGSEIYIGTMAGAVVMCFNRFSGVLVWQKQISTHPAAIISSSPVVHNGKVYVGISSNEESFDSDITYVCCSFRGSFVALSALNGALLWEVYMVPVGYAGAAIWGSSPPVDSKRNQIIITTGNLYSIPASVFQCQNATANITSFLIRDPCRARMDFSESIVALDLDTGRLIWAQQVGAIDVSTTACGAGVLGITFVPANANCAKFFGPDADFGEDPMFIPGNPAITPDGQDLLIVGQKSGVIWFLEADTGKLVNSVIAGPGGGNGGLIWGSATNGTSVFFTSANSNKKNHTLNNGRVITSSSWGALDIKSGQIVWQTPDVWVGAELGFLAVPVSYANGLVYSGSYDILSPTGGRLTILNAHNGAILFQKTFGNHHLGGVSIFGNTLYFATGYNPDLGTVGTLYAYGL